MSYLTQMAGLAWHNFTSAAAGICVALAVARGFTRRGGPGGGKQLGNFWVDLNRGILYVLLPLSFIFALVLVSQGVIQNLKPYLDVTTLEGGKQTLALGPVASQEAIKQLGTNGGGFFNANAAHPFENPTPFTNLISLFLIFMIPAGLTYTYGRMAKDAKQGWALLAAMSVLFFAGVAACYHAETAGNSAFAGLPIHQVLGNMEGKETRFGVAASTLYATVTTDASCGAVNAMHDSFTPLGGLVPLVNIQLGEVIFGGVGAGLYGILVFVVLAVFIAGLMVGRTPEYLGKKIEAREIQLGMFYVLVFPIIILGFSAWAAVSPLGTSSLNNGGAHGLSEILYAYSSGAGNNGSAFAGLNANTPFWNITLGLTMLAGRFLMIIPALGIAGLMVDKKVVPPSLGTFPTNGPLFTAPAGDGGGDRRRAHLLPGALARPHRRALPGPARKGLLVMSSKAQSVGLFDRAILRQAVGESFRKLSPRMVAKNPVMFVVEVGSALTTLLVIRDLVVRAPGHAPLWFTGAVSIWLWFTVLFANFAEAIAEGRGRAQADTLRKMRKETMARRLARRRQARRPRGGGPLVVAAQRRSGGRGGESAGPRRRRDRRGDRLRRRVGHHRRVGARHPRERRRSLGRHRRHQGALRPDRGPDRQRSRRVVPRSHDLAGRRAPPARRRPTRSRCTSCWSG